MSPNDPGLRDLESIGTIRAARSKPFKVVRGMACDIFDFGELAGSDARSVGIGLFSHAVSSVHHGEA
jgi:hypothetical protein